MHASQMIDRRQTDGRNTAA